MATAFKTLVTDSRAKMDPKFMVPGKLDAAAPQWQQDVNKAVLKSLANWAKGLTGLFGKEVIRDSFMFDHWWMCDNFRTYDAEHGPASDAQMVMWVAKQGGGVFTNLFSMGIPASINIVSGVIVGQMKKIQHREVYYEVVATYIVPQFKDGAFVEDTWPTTTPSGRSSFSAGLEKLGLGSKPAPSESPNELEERYVWTLSACAAKSNATGKLKDKPKGTEVTCVFYEMHMWKLYKEGDELKAGLVVLSEMNADLGQTLNNKGKPLHADAKNAIDAFAAFVDTAKITVLAGEDAAAYSAARRHFLSQKAMLTGKDPIGGDYKEEAEAELATMS